MPLVQWAAVTARGGVRCVGCFLWREERQTGLRKLSLKPDVWENIRLLVNVGGFVSILKSYQYMHSPLFCAERPSGAADGGAWQCKLLALVGLWEVAVVVGGAMGRNVVVGQLRVGWV